MNLLDNFIEGLQLIRDKFLKDGESWLSTGYQAIFVCNIDWNKVTAEDVRKMCDLGFYPGDDEEDLGEVTDEQLKKVLDSLMNEIGEIELQKLTDEQWEVLKKSLSNSFKYCC